METINKTVPIHTKLNECFVLAYTNSRYKVGYNGYNGVGKSCKKKKLSWHDELFHQLQKHRGPLQFAQIDVIVRAMKLVSRFYFQREYR